MMKTNPEPSFASFQPGGQNPESEGRMVRHILEQGSPLPAEALAELEALAAMPDGEIDFSDIPPMTDRQLEEFVAGPWTPLAEHTLTLKVDAEVLEWIEAAKSDPHQLNLALKRTAQLEKRARSATPSPLSKAS